MTAGWTLQLTPDETRCVLDADANLPSVDARGPVPFDGEGATIAEQAGDAFDLLPDGFVVKEAGVYAVSAAVFCVSPGDATRVGITLSDAASENWGPHQDGHPSGRVAVASTYHFPAGDKVTVNVSHDASSPRAMAASVWLCRVS